MPPRVRTLQAENAHQRHTRLFRTAQEAYSHGRAPPRPQTKHDLDVLKERNQFIRDEGQREADLSWEDALALKYYQTLFREYAVVNLKHYKTGAIALRWRTETEVLAGIAHLTCGSMRCPNHLPSPRASSPDPESLEPLVDVPLYEYEVPFAYVEEGVRKNALVKVMLCVECGRRLLYGRETKKKEDRRRQEEDRDEHRPELPDDIRSAREAEREDGRRRLHTSHPSGGDARSRRRSASPPHRSKSRENR